MLSKERILHQKMCWRFERHRGGLEGTPKVAVYHSNTFRVEIRHPAPLSEPGGNDNCYVIKRLLAFTEDPQLLEQKRKCFGKPFLLAVDAQDLIKLGLRNFLVQRLPGTERQAEAPIQLATSEWCVCLVPVNPVT